MHNAFILFIMLFIFSCEQNMEINVENEFADPQQLTKHLKIVNDDNLINGSFYVEGVQYDNVIWASFLENKMSISIMDLVGTDPQDSLHISDLGNVFFYDNIMHSMGRIYVYEHYNNYSDLSLMNLDEKMTVRSEASTSYYGFNYEFKHSFNELQNAVTIITNFDETEIYNIEDDLQIELNQNLRVDGGLLRIEFAFRTDDSYTDHSGRESNRGYEMIYLKATEELDEYLISSDKIKILLELAIKKHKRFLLNYYSIESGFDTGELTSIVLVINQFNYNYDKVQLVHLSSPTIKELDVVTATFDAKRKATDSYRFDFSEEEASDVVD